MTTNGGLYLGRPVDPGSGRTNGEKLLLDPDDLTTHGLIVGMTGSGKTALGIVLIEELLRRGVPVLAIDPKGDLGNLLLTFPRLSPEEFSPWVDSRGGTTPEGEAKRWAEGLAAWGLGPSDVAACAASREAAIYTPGGAAGLPLDLVGSCPPPPKDADAEDRRDVLTAFAAGALGLAGIDADPVRSRELILLVACIEALWEKGEAARLESLVGCVAAPPFATVGALPLETFFPAKERQALVLALNNVVASPATAAFRSGEPLDVGAMLSPGAGGRPRLSIVSIAHLSDAERLFVVATLLSRFKAFMRSQPGSTSLKALLYVDEIFGFFPPSANPPTKPPLLTLLKQARAFGFGVVLATQNPVDLDYKGLANCGCWWVGTLQAARDKERLASGLTDAGGGDATALLSKTRKRVFLLHDVHGKGPLLMETRWALSYLRGPMTRDEIARAMGPRAAGGVPAAAAEEIPVVEGPPPVPAPWTAKWVRKKGADIASPWLYVKYAVRYRAGAGPASPEKTGVRLFPLSAAGISDVVEADAMTIDPSELLEEAPGKFRYAGMPGWLGAATVKGLEKSIRDRLPDKLATTLRRDPVTKALSLPGETDEEFARRIAAESAPAALKEKLEEKRRALQAAEAAEKSREMETYASMASAAVDLLGGLLGKRKAVRVGRVGSVLTKKRMEGTAESRVEALRAEVEELQAKVAPPEPGRFESVPVVPQKSQVDILSIGVAWVV